MFTGGNFLRQKCKFPTAGNNGQHNLDVGRSMSDGNKSVKFFCTVSWKAVYCAFICYFFRINIICSMLDQHFVFPQKMFNNEWHIYFCSVSL